MTQKVKDLIAAIPTTWRPVLFNLIARHEDTINALLKEQASNDPQTIFPPTDDIFNAFKYFDIEETKAVIIGMDVYPTRGHATGLCFSVDKTVRPIPASLRNIIKELEEEYPGLKWPIADQGGDISHWAKTEHVLMLNTALTVKESQPGSHLRLWTEFTKSIIDHLNKHFKNIVYILWGNHAKAFVDIIDAPNNHVLVWSHPSPLSRKPFLGNGHFRKCNDYLSNNGKTIIQWFPSRSATPPSNDIKPPIEVSQPTRSAPIEIPKRKKIFIKLNL